MPRPSLLERAFELARSGRYQSEEAIIGCLNREGYVDVEDHLYSASVRRDVKRLIKLGIEKGSV